MAGPLLVVDAPSLLFRSWFALPDSITDGEGRPVNALLGVTNYMLRTIAAHRPRPGIPITQRLVAVVGAEGDPRRRQQDHGGDDPAPQQQTDHDRERRQ